jgi:nicotinamide phosphoribosyltransferase
MRINLNDFTITSLELAMKPLLAIDFYKAGHYAQYPQGTNKVYSNFTARSSHHFPVELQSGEKVLRSLWFGGSMALVKLHTMWRPFFEYSDIDAICTAYETFMMQTLGPAARVTSQHIRQLHGVGYLPLEIKALPEGSLVNIGVPYLTITNTVDHAYWLVNYVESWLSATLWKTVTVATIAYNMRRLLGRYQGAQDFIDWQAHDFSFRGMSGDEDSIAAGIAHLALFKGTDNCSAIYELGKYYDVDADTFIGGSVPATEHSVMCMTGNGPGAEQDLFKRLITEIYPTGIVSVVSDTWNLWEVVTTYMRNLKDIIMARDGKLVIRPDSGNPLEILLGTLSFNVVQDYNKMTTSYTRCNDKRYFFLRDTACYYVYDRGTDTFNPYYPTPEEKGVLMCLWEIFSGSQDVNGYRTLDSHIGIIYGDSITYELMSDILETADHMGFSKDNFVFGVGSYTYQYLTRDSLGMAMKATYGEVNGEGRVLYKDPVTGNGKRSARGLLAVQNLARPQFRDTFTPMYELVQNIDASYEGEDCLQPVYVNGTYSKANWNQVRDTITRFLNDDIDGD